MRADLPPPAIGEGVSLALPPIPAFIHEIPGMAGKSDNPFHLFDFWVPERLGHDDLDFATGERHFWTALAFAQAGRSTNFIANIVGGMCAVGAGPMERGFLSVLSRKATVGRVPPPITDAMIREVVTHCDRTEEEMRHGEAEAREFLDIARDCNGPEIIESFMIDVVNRDLGYGSLSFMWTVCGAAYAGAAH